MNVVQPIRGEKGATLIGLDAELHGTEHRAIVDTHRHPIGPKLAAKMAERGFYDPKTRIPADQRSGLDRLSRVLRSGLRHAQAAAAPRRASADLVAERCDAAICPEAGDKWKCAACA